MDINAANLEALNKNYSVDWQKGIAWKPPVDLSFLFMDVKSTSAANFYAWLNLIPGFREWVGDRIFFNVQSQKFEVSNVPYEASVTMGKSVIDDDKDGGYSVYAPIIRQMAEAWPQLLHELVVAVLTGNPTCFTASALFANSHAYGDQIIDNLVTDALSETSFNAAFEARAGYKWANGKEIPGTFTHLIVGEKLRKTGYELVLNQYLSVAGGSTSGNPNYKKCELVVLPSLTGTYDDYWFLSDASGSMRPICRQIRQVPVPLMDTNPATVMRSGKVDYMADGRAAAAPTFPHLIYGGRL